MEINFNELDGKRFYYSFIAGAQKIFDQYKGINKINVFPVADGDTGTNLASTLRSIIDTAIPTNNIKVTAVALADAALVGARGNSGIIFAQFLYGFSNEIKEERNLTVDDFAELLIKGVKYSYEAIANPVEGTMISVMRDWAEYIYLLKDKIRNFNQLIIQSYDKAQQALKETPAKLEILAKNHVVDAGAMGFVVFLEGMIEFFSHGELKRLATTRNIVKVKEFEEVVHEEGEIKFRYCTEALISLNTKDDHSKAILKDKISPLGDSLVIAGSPKKLRIHIHTDQPAELFSMIKDIGTTSYKKVDDMVMQNQVVLHRKWNIALVADSTCDLPNEIIEKYQIQVVPLTVHFDKDFYLDTITITPEQFYKLLVASDQNPTTAQPTYKDFTNKYGFLSSYYNSIIGIHISEKLSGTFSNSRKASWAIRERQEKDIAVFSSNKVSVALGLQVLRAAQAIEDGNSFKEVTSAIKDWIGKTHLMVNTPTLKYLIRGGRVSLIKGFFGKLLKVQPVLKVSAEGKAELWGKPTSTEQGMRMVLQEAIRLMDGKKLWGYAIAHAQNPDGAKWYATEMEAITGMKPKFISSASPVLGTHVGPGVVGLAILLE